MVCSNLPKAAAEYINSCSCCERNGLSHAKSIRTSVPYKLLETLTTKKLPGIETARTYLRVKPHKLLEAYVLYLLVFREQGDGVEGGG